MGAPDPLADKVILFDGVCNLCNSSVQFIIRHDPTGKFKFASLQSSFGQEQLKNFNIPSEAFNSVILISDGVAYERSDAALEIAKNLSGFWKKFYLFRIVPRFLRNGIYDLVSKNRYRVFGKRDECMIPTPELKSRFIS